MTVHAAANAGRSSDRAVIGAFFDMDHTVLRGSSGLLYLKYLRQIGYLSAWRWPPVLIQVVLYAVHAVDFPHMMGRLTAHVTGADEAEAWRLSEAWFNAMLGQHIAEAARERIAWHRDQGHHVALMSAATPYAVAPVARSLGLAEAYVATNLKVEQGRFTGHIVEPACFGHGKLSLARGYAEKWGIDLRRSYFYSDSHDDLPLLEAVGTPVAVNPSRKLARIARARGWSVTRFY